ncbi:MAG TPA: DUF5916 domain-containing protein, partial [Gemmatimonadales bacterium]|nr:DUF5916 domain-containing protein [Gemmatimonadales bacterium]
KEGAAASEPTEVRVLFDDDAIYVGARLRDTSPDSIVAQLARRDRITSADRFIVYIDAYHDRRSGLYFGINAAGTLYDGTLYNDDWDDDSWDGVWEGRVARDTSGWTAELRIPYSQLRFQRRAAYVWGINFKREIARRNEEAYLAPRPLNGNGFVSRFAELTGIEQVTPPARLEVMPYVTAKAQSLAHDPGDPFNSGVRATPGAGADLKLGLGSNLTLDATVNPDFGQVEVDPAVVNLTDIESFFPERRPFFVEGSSIFHFGEGGATEFWGFNWGGADFLYSRRIGRAPQGTLPDADFSSTPSGTHILGALKLTGKAGSWSLGGLSALTKREFANLATGSSRWRSEVEPLTYYGVGRAQKEFHEGRQGLGFIGTAVARSFGTGTLQDELNRTAFAVGVDGWTALDRAGAWMLTAWVGGTRVSGTAAQMLALQQNSVHYFQRPDATHLRLDSAATSLAGLAGRVTVNKQKGNWMFNGAVGVMDPGFEANDVGFQFFSDQVNAHLMGGYRWTRPSRLFQSAVLNLATYRNWTLGGDLTSTGYFLRGNFVLRNFSEWRWYVEYDPESLNARRTRGGPLSLNPPGVDFDMQLTGNSQKQWIPGLVVHGSHYARQRQHSWSIGPSLEWRPGARMSLQVAPTMEWLRTAAQYVDTFDDPVATDTYGRRYLFGALDQRTLSASIRLNWIFTPRMSLELYAQPLLSSGAYTDYKTLARPRTYDFTLTSAAEAAPSDPGQLVVTPPEAGAAQLQFDRPDFSIASLRGNAVLRWEYHPGSTLYLVWTQNRSDDVGGGSFRLGDGLSRMLTGAADNVFLVKLSYWWRP